MATVLLLLIYLAYIGLGIPDPLFGAAWPAIRRDFDVPIAAANIVTLLISGCTVISSLCSAGIIRRWGTGIVTALSTALTALALFGFSLSGNMLWLCVFAAPLGMGAGAIDTALNHFVALHYRAIHMNFLHCFCSLGVTLSPYLMALALTADERNWQGGYRIAALLQLFLAAMTFLALPLWNAVARRSRIPEAETEMETAAGVEEKKASGVNGSGANGASSSFGMLLRRAPVRWGWGIFLGTCAIEYTCGIWASSYLVACREMPIAAAAKVVTLYYAGILLGRFLAGILSLKLSCWKLIYFGEGIILSGVLLLLFPDLPVICTVTGLFLIGLGTGPIFPNLLHLTVENFGSENSVAVMGTQMAAAYTGIMLIPPLFGVLAQFFAVGVLPGFLLVLFVVMSGATIRFRQLRCPVK